MLEQQRIEYLQAMGIQLWMPREALPDAAESTWLANDLVDGGGNQESGVAVQAGHAADLLAGMGLGNTAPTSAEHADKNQVKASSPNTTLKNNSVDEVDTEKPSLTNSASEESNSYQPASENTKEESSVDLTAPRFELYFALWPCGILWVSGSAFEQKDHLFQTAVSYSLLGNAVPQANYSQFKWPYLEGSNEDQSIAVALRALTAQWEFMSGQGARGWVALDENSYEWLAKVASKPLYSVETPAELFTLQGKKQLWKALQALPSQATS